MKPEDWRATECVDGHKWGFYKRDKFESCRVCGYIRRADKKNGPCRGPVRITLRSKNATLISELENLAGYFASKKLLLNEAGMAAMEDCEIQLRGIIERNR